MEIVTSAQVLEQRIQTVPILILLYGSRSCRPCGAICRKLKAWEAGHPGIACLYLPIESLPQAAAQAGIFTVPTLLVYVEGKPSIRESGCFSLQHILSKVEFYLSYLT